MANLVVKRNPDPAEFKRIHEAILENRGFCISCPEHSQETKCPCRAFRAQNEPGPCKCGLFLKVEHKEEMKRIWDNYMVCGEIQKSDSIKFVVAAAIRDGVKYINIHEFYFRKKDGVWRPGRDGITVPLVVPINKGTERITPYTGLIELVMKTANALTDMPLADEANAVYIVKKEKANENP